MERRQRRGWSARFDFVRFVLRIKVSNVSVSAAAVVSVHWKKFDGSLPNIMFLRNMINSIKGHMIFVVYFNIYFDSVTIERTSP